MAVQWEQFDYGTTAGDGLGGRDILMSYFSPFGTSSSTSLSEQFGVYLLPGVQNNSYKWC